MTSQYIRPIAICVFRRNGHILVTEAIDTVKHETFYRPIGGGIEFGEHSSTAVRREIQEEIGAEIRDLHLIGTLENIFTYNGSPGHEIAQVYDAEFVNESLYSLPHVSGVENNGEQFQALWKAIDQFSTESPLYPEGLLELLSPHRTGESQHA
jgi:8-oxo-dGTP pyrophosphatase MutT (NUDIX family)